MTNMIYSRRDRYGSVVLQWIMDILYHRYNNNDMNHICDAYNYGCKYKDTIWHKILEDSMTTSEVDLRNKPHIKKYGHHMNYRNLNKLYKKDLISIIRDSGLKEKWQRYFDVYPYIFNPNRVNIVIHLRLDDVKMLKKKFLKFSPS